MYSTKTKRRGGRIGGTGNCRTAKSGHGGYTLLEICLAMVVVAVMIGATLPITQGIISEERLRGFGNDLADVASTARKLAVREGRAYAVVFGEGRVSLGPWTGEKSTMDETLALSLPRNATVAVRRDDSEKWRGEHVWIFQPGGLAEPLQMKLNEGASWCLKVFNPLTSLPREEASHFQ